MATYVVQKTWTTDEEVELPDGLTEAEIAKWCDENVAELANEGISQDEVSWESTELLEDYCDDSVWSTFR